MAEDQDTRTQTTRRGALAALAFASVGVAPGLATPVTDADILRICARHAVTLSAYQRDGGKLEAEECPLWAAYQESIDAIDAARPQSMTGILAIARAAKLEALGLGDDEDPANCPAADWGWKIVNDLIRLAGEPGEVAA
ncbi:hypothetical protein ACQW02_09090 [Humitalea sp. 24SJ18S-53]|uniref:hypothetical protein n=1 Tax=Humitalea sp. 24SJ18S-53 TaxID=3422307 RepID=UPI003D667696